MERYRKLLQAIVDQMRLGRDSVHGPEHWRQVGFNGLLVRACREHTSARVPTGDPTVDTCLDADRLDLVRVGILPDPGRLLTDAARALARRARDERVTLHGYRAFLRSQIPSPRV